MIKSLQITNYLGEEFVITLPDGEPKHGMIIQSIDGLGPAQANINTTELANNDGSNYNSSRLMERNIVFNLILYPAPSIEEARHLVYRCFPIKKYVDIIIVTDIRELRTRGYVESNDPQIFSKQEGVTVSIICPDPYLYSRYNEIAHAYMHEPLFEFEFSNESLKSKLIQMGEIHYPERAAVIDYKGSIETGVIIKVHTFANFVFGLDIWNLTTDERMTLSIPLGGSHPPSNFVTGKKFSYDEAIGKLRNEGISDKKIPVVLFGEIAKDFDISYLEGVEEEALNVDPLDYEELDICTIRGKKSIIEKEGGRIRNRLRVIDKGSKWIRLVPGQNIIVIQPLFDDNANVRFETEIEYPVIYEGV